MMMTIMLVICIWVMAMIALLDPLPLTVALHGLPQM